MQGCFKAGADPELMIISPEGELVSAIGLVPGTKKRPRKVAKGAVQRDNVNAEFNIQPADSSEEFTENIRTVLGELSRIVAPNRLEARASADFPKRLLQSREARTFGCDPDFDSWTLSINSIDGSAAFDSFRSAGGHLHIGKKPETAEMLDDPYGKVEVVKMLDIFVGIPSVWLDPDPSARARRSLYGKAGAHRPKPYGVEYRSLGNFWIRSPELADLIYELADLAVQLTLEGKSQELIERVGVSKIVETINNSQAGEAKKIIQKHLTPYLSEKLLMRILGQAPIKAIEGMSLVQAWAL